MPAKLSNIDIAFLIHQIAVKRKRKQSGMPDPQGEPDESAMFSRCIDMMLGPASGDEVRRFAAAVKEVYRVIAEDSGDAV